jgi:hypothetical protein
MCHVTFFKDCSDDLGTFYKHFITIMIKICLYSGPMFIKSIRKISNFFYKSYKGHNFPFWKVFFHTRWGRGLEKCYQMSHVGRVGLKSAKKVSHIIWKAPNKRGSVDRISLDRKCDFTLDRKCDFTLDRKFRLH